MSLGYAEKLSFKEDVGTLGMSEIFDPPVILQQKIEQLAGLILERQGKGAPEASLPFDRAMPSLTHMALVELVRIGILKFVISQNVDCLHLRSGIPREKLAELHGNSFRESCPTCGKEYIRDFEVETIGLKKTPRRCSSNECKERLRDTVLDWEDELPSKEMIIAEKHCQVTDLVLCLGTSLQITPACDLPSKALRNGGKVAIVNLQQTPKDEKASLVIHGFVDKVMTGVMQCLNLRIPPFVRVDLFQIVLTHFLRLSDKRYMKWTLRVASVHGVRSPMPYIKSVEVSFPGRPELKTAILSKQPFILKREMIKARPFTIMLKLNFGEGCGTRYTNVEYPVDFQATSEDVDYGTEAVSQMLRETSIRDQCCGQVSIVEKKSLGSPKGEAAIYAVATNIGLYGHTRGPAHGHHHSMLAHNIHGQAHGMMAHNIHGMAHVHTHAHHHHGHGSGFSLMAPLAPLQTPIPAPPQALPFVVPEPQSNNNSMVKRKLPDLGGPDLAPGQKGLKEFRVDYRPFEPFWPNFFLSHQSKQ
ncbi:hypothetical protein V2J09_000156 [Rumex salicifolius]